MDLFGSLFRLGTGGSASGGSNAQGAQQRGPEGRGKESAEVLSKRTVGQIPGASAIPVQKADASEDEARNDNISMPPVSATSLKTILETLTSDFDFKSKMLIKDSFGADMSLSFATEGKDNEAIKVNKYLETNIKSLFSESLCTSGIRLALEKIVNTIDVDIHEAKERERFKEKRNGQYKVVDRDANTDINKFYPHLVAAIKLLSTYRQKYADYLRLPTNDINRLYYQAWMRVLQYLSQIHIIIVHAAKTEPRLLELLDYATDLALIAQHEASNEEEIRRELASQTKTMLELGQKKAAMDLEFDAIRQKYSGIPQQYDDAVMCKDALLERLKERDDIVNNAYHNITEIAYTTSNPELLVPILQGTDAAAKSQKATEIIKRHEDNTYRSQR